MTRAAPPLLVLVLIASIRCGGGTGTPPQDGGGQNPPPQNPPPSGSERLAWDQRIPAGENASVYRFAAYVDSARVDLPSATCGSPSSEVASCTSPLPAMTPGRHVLELVSFRLPDGVESERAAPVTIEVAGQTPTPHVVADQEPGAAGEAGQANPDCSVNPMGTQRALLATSDGRLQTLAADGTESTGLDWDSPEGQWTLRSAAAHPAFDTNHFVYVLMTGTGPDAGRLQVVRYRELAGVLGERAVVFAARLDTMAARPRLRTGPDASLVLGLLDGPGTPETEEPRRFLMRLDDRGALAAESRRQSVFMDPEAVQPFELDWPAAARTPWTLSGRSPYLRGPADHAVAAAQGPVPIEVSPGAVPIGMSVREDPAATRIHLWLAASDGAIERLEFRNGRWLASERSQIVDVDVLYDARLLADESAIAYCGSFGSGDAAALEGRVLSVRPR